VLSSILNARNLARDKTNKALSTLVCEMIKKRALKKVKLAEVTGWVRVLLWTGGDGRRPL
jgi:hypothetical protein